jgi:uncharacterized protein (DUF488 family)
LLNLEIRGFTHYGHPLKHATFRHMITPGVIYSIGHSNHASSVFTGLLARHGIQAVADVRSAPYSRFHPQFCREALADHLRQGGVDYVFLGRELGARSEDPTCYEEGRIQYGRLSQTALFQGGLGRLEAVAATRRTALMCSEREPLDCHRTLLVAQELAKRGHAVAHILADGSLERHEDTMQRLLDLTRVPRDDLFRSPQDLLADALAVQEQKIVYVLPKPLHRNLPDLD